MSDYSLMTREQLIQELKELRQRVNDLEASDNGKRPADAPVGNEQQLRSMRDMIEHTADAFFIVDSDGTLVDTNRSACDSLGYSREEILALSITDICNDFNGPAMSEVYEGLVSGGGPVILEKAVHRKDGTDIPVEVR